jgi:S-adenosyl-L-methionine hydrolase (adenosine-forming)
MQLRLITLLSDFGLSDVYVGVMKGVIAQVSSDLTIVDLTHDIPPQDIAAARFSLMSAYLYFPPGTVHITVVDPGVGSTRRAVAVQIAEGFLVGPDNGLFSGVFNQSPPMAAVELTNSAYWRSVTPSSTFHGRDIFAPVGAHLASGVAFDELGQRIDPATLIQLPVQNCCKVFDGSGEVVELQGVIQAIDRFGNLITNIPGQEVVEKNWSLAVAGRTLPGQKTYAMVKPHDLLALVGSHGWVEIAVNQGNAKAQLELDYGSEVTVFYRVNFEPEF